MPWTTFSNPFSTTYARLSVVKHCSSNLALENFTTSSFESQFEIKTSSPPHLRSSSHNLLPSSWPCFGISHAFDIISLNLSNIVGTSVLNLGSRNVSMVSSSLVEYLMMAFSTSWGLAFTRNMFRSSKFSHKNSSNEFCLASNKVELISFLMKLFALLLDWLDWKYEKGKYLKKKFIPIYIIMKTATNFIIFYK